MPRTLKKIQPQSLPILKSTLHFHRILFTVQNPAENSLHKDTELSREQHKNSQRSQLEDIPELEDKDLEDGHFVDADLIDHHNTKTESN